ncbi:MAG TPA: excinuclease ABC subunit UvrC, partial [Tepidiformaceae bacterium]|nr:excinuclease ABC subunit UvrC [Tepidiformaceae bacterium]
EYERAAQLRDQLRSIERTVERQMVATTRKEDVDIFGIARDGDQACVQVFFVRGTQMIGRDTFVLEGVRDEEDQAILTNFLLQYYEGAQYIPKLVAIPADPEDRDTIEELLSEKRGSLVEVRVPERGEKKRLVELAGENAKESLSLMRVKWMADANKTELALEQLTEELSLPGIPRRIECYDNSNIQGTNPVSSMVVFVDGKPETSQYRRFKVKTVVGADDFATMAEVLRRRFKNHGNSAGHPGGAAVNGSAPEGGEDSGSEAAPPHPESWDLPDLVIIDGGKGQLGAAVGVMRELGVHHIPTVGLAKRFEELFVPDEDEPVVLPRGSEALYLVQRVRDEAHRFAITFHRQVRARSSIQSALDTIPGIGPKRKKALLRKFGSVKQIREAGVEEIASTVGFTKALAEKVKAEL